MEDYLTLNILIKIGSKIRLVAKVFDNETNNKSPIDDVPLCGERYKVLNEKIVVKPLNKIAEGVFEENNFLKSPNSSNRFIKYIG